MRHDPVFPAAYDYGAIGSPPASVTVSSLARRLSLLHVICTVFHSPPFLLLIFGTVFGAMQVDGQQYEVLVLLAQGASNRDIAEKLCITEGTVKNHVSNILAKLQAENRTRAADIDRRYGLA